MGSAIEWINPVTPRRFKAVIFDFDGTLSLIREGWQEIMYSYFVEVLKTAPNAEPEEELWHNVMDFVDHLTGKQTIYQTIRLAEEYSRRGGHPEDPLVYKREYNRRLLEKIAYRIKGLKAGTIDPVDLLVPGAVDLLSQLRAAGLVLYLASGTDEQYVIEEATALGVKDFFNGGVYGALDDYKKFSKAQVIARIIAENNIVGEELLGFGDGYVEIENVKAVGGVGIGVASDEQRREGINAWKRDRLIKAGADAIIGDYRCQKELLTHLGIMGGNTNAVQAI